MIAQAMQFIRDLADNARKPQVTLIPGVRRRSLLTHADGRIEYFNHDYPLSTAKVTTIYSFCELFNYSQIEGRQQIFIGPDKAVAVIDRDEPDGTITLPLVHSQQMKTMVAQAGETLNHADFMRMVRIDLAGCLPSALVDRLRRVEAASTQAATVELKLGRDRGTREFVNEIAGAADIPEEVVVVLPDVFCIPDLPTPGKIPCILELEVDRGEATFSLHPKADALSRVVSDAMKIVHSAIKAGLDVPEIPIVFGSPK